MNEEENIIKKTYIHTRRNEIFFDNIPEIYYVNIQKICYV